MTYKIIFLLLLSFQAWSADPCFLLLEEANGKQLRPTFSWGEESRITHTQKEIELLQRKLEELNEAIASRGEDSTEAEFERESLVYLLDGLTEELNDPKVMQPTTRINNLKSGRVHVRIKSEIK